jgi:hypothetical protein
MGMPICVTLEQQNKKQQSKSKKGPLDALLQ